jgi:hypothetical protein
MNLNKILEKISSWMSIVGVLVAVFAFLITTFYRTARDNKTVQLMSIEQSYMVTEKIQKKIEDLEKKLTVSSISSQSDADSIKNLKTQIDKLEEEQQKILLLASVQRMDPQLQQKLVESISNRVQTDLSQAIKSSVDGIGKRLGDLESLIVSDPNKALSIPILRRDIHDLNQEFTILNGKTDKIDQVLLENAVLKSQTQSLKEQLSQLNNWMIGIFGALGVSVIGLVINNIVLQRKSEVVK